MEKYYPDIYQYCLLHMSDAYDAQDLTQEVVVSFFGHLDSYREYGKVKKYLYTIAGNAVKNYYRKKKELPLEILPEDNTQQTDDIRDAGPELFYGAFCVKKSLQFDERSLESFADGIRM